MPALPSAVSAPPPSGWLRAIYEALVVAHLGVANASDTYEQAKAKLDNLIGFHVDVATDPAVNGGWKLMPVATVIKEGDSRYWMSERLWTFPDGKYPLYALPGAQQCKNCNGMGSRFDPSGEKIPCDLCESHLEEIRSLVAEAVHDIISGGDFWLSISLAAKKIYALPGAQGEEK